jgi:hypothetical protein
MNQRIVCLVVANKAGTMGAIDGKLATENIHRIFDKCGLTEDEIDDAIQIILGNKSAESLNLAEKT